MDKETGRQEAADASDGGARGMPEVCAEVSGLAAAAVQKRIGVFGRLIRPYATMNPQYESVVLSTFFSLLRKRIRLQGSARGLLVHARYDETSRAGRGGGRKYGENHTSPTVYVKYKLLDDPAKIDAGSGRKNVSTIIWTYYSCGRCRRRWWRWAFHPDEEYVGLESGWRSLHCSVETS